MKAFTRPLKKALAFVCVLSLLAPATAQAAVVEGMTQKVDSASKIDISKATVTVADQTYTGKEQTATVTVELDSKALTEDVDYVVSGNVNKNAGEYTVTVTGKAPYTGEVKATYKINAKAISATTIKVGDLTYTGKKQTAKVTVKDGSKKLVEGKDYKVTNNTATNAGTKKITVKGIGNYAGSAKVNLVVNKAKQKITYKTPAVKASAVAKKSKTYKLNVKGVKEKAKVTYKSNSKKITVNDKGVVTVKKGTKKGTTAKITISVASTKNYKKLTQTLNIKVK